MRTPTATSGSVTVEATKVATGNLEEVTSLEDAGTIGPGASTSSSRQKSATDGEREGSLAAHTYSHRSPRSRSAVLSRLSDGETSSATTKRRVGIEYLSQFWLTSAPLVLIDLFLLTICIAAARQTVYLFGGVMGMDVSSCFLPIATGFVLISGEMGLYPGIRLSPVEEMRRLIVGVTCMFGMWTVGVALLLGALTVQRWFLILAYILCAISLPIGRMIARRLLGQCSWWGFPTLICGDDAAAIRLSDWLQHHPELGLRPVGVIGDAGSLAVDGADSWYTGDWSEAPEIAIRQKAYWALVVPDESSRCVADEILHHLSVVPHVQVMSELTGLPDHWGPHQPVDGLAGVHLQQNLMLPLPRFTKRTLDLVAASVALCVLLPLLVGIMLAVRLTSRGPVFFGHERIGMGGRRFRAWKFRSMVLNADKVLSDYLDSHPELKAEWAKDHKLKRDPRITTVGRFLRKTSLDELPQLWNVLVGEMSLVGPRPIVEAEIIKYGDCYWLYSTVKPGITGLWQVSGRNNTTYIERVTLDAYYVRNWSPWLDLYLLMRTVRIVLLAEGAY